MKIAVPWNAAWSGEDGAFEIRPCRFAENRPAIWQPHKPGVGRPMFAEPHLVRQRRSIAEMRCTVCGDPTPSDNRWWFEHGQHQDGWFMTTEAPVHRACAIHALSVCPHLRDRSIKPSRFPSGARMMIAIVKPESLPGLFKLTNANPVVGQLKLAWPSNSVVRLPA